MRFKNISKLAALAGLALLGSAASAATVSCPGSVGGTVPTQNGKDTVTIDRQIQVTGALAGGLCRYQEGNFNGDDFSDYFASYTLIDKDITSENPNGSAEGSLRYTLDDGNKSGSWETFASVWNTYDKLFLAMHFGGGGGAPDSFIVELERATLTGDWDLLPSRLATGLSNIYLLGTGRCTVDCGGGSSSGNQVPEPGSLTLLGLGILGLGAAARRRRAN